MQAAETTLVKSLATTIQKKLVNPTEEQFKQLDSKINNLSVKLETGQSSLKQETEELSEKLLAIKKELNNLSLLHKKTRLLAIIVLTWSALNTFLLFTNH